MVWALVDKDPFLEVTEAEGGVLEDALRGLGSVRRPLLGVQDYRDTYSYMSVVSRSDDGRPVYWGLLDQGSATGLSSHWSNFLVEAVQERRMEKTQVIQTFGANYYFFFGEEPRFLMVSGKVFQGSNFNWASEFKYVYKHYLRGSKCAETQSRVVLQIDGVIYEGMLVSMALDTTADYATMRPLTFNFAILSEHDTRVPENTTGKPPEEYTTFRSHTATVLRTGALTSDDVAPTTVGYYETGNWVEGAGGYETEAHTPDGRVSTDPAQPKVYDDKGRVVTKSRASLRGTGDSVMPLYGKNDALLELDLIVNGSSRSPGDRGYAKYQQRQAGAHKLGSRTAAVSLENALTEGVVAGGILEIA